MSKRSPNLSCRGTQRQTSHAISSSRRTRFSSTSRACSTRSAYAAGATSSERSSSPTMSHGCGTTNVAPLRATRCAVDQSTSKLRQAANPDFSRLREPHSGRCAAPGSVRAAGVNLLPIARWRATNREDGECSCRAPGVLRWLEPTELLHPPQVQLRVRASGLEGWKLLVFAPHEEGADVGFAVDTRAVLERSGTSPPPAHWVVRRSS